jgi:AraC family transcriptional regulator of adaptative response / DNA-3-methyladenine glycosylase II
MGFLGARAVTGVEAARADEYVRSVRLGEHVGWIAVHHRPARRSISIEVSPGLTPVLPAVLGRVRRLFDLDARPDIIASHLAEDPRLAVAVARSPGRRVPGAFDGFELAVRAILGQQVTVASATRQAGRLAQAFGESIDTPHAEISRLSPTAGALAAAGAERVAAAGVVASRARAIVALAREVAAGRLTLDAGADPRSTIERLTALPGIGPWTAEYIAMRALRWPDAFPKEDVAVRRALGGVSPAEADALSQPWRPWRSYAVMQLWGMG